jgi:hypothetical protein
MTVSAPGCWAKEDEQRMRVKSVVIMDKLLMIFIIFCYLYIYWFNPFGVGILSAPFSVGFTHGYSSLTPSGFSKG